MKTAYNPARAGCPPRPGVLSWLENFITTEDTEDTEIEGAAFASRNRISRENFSALPEPELPRVVGLLRRQRVRSASRARVQRHPQRGRADRHLAALQVSDHRQGRHQAGEPHHHPRHHQGESGPGDLLLLVRRAGQSDRRRHHHAPGRKQVSLDRRRSQPALVPAERLEHGRSGRRHFRATRRARVAGADLGQAAEGGCRSATSPISNTSA